MRYAIIAAGEGSRLAQEGVAVPKPLVRVGGETLLERLVRIFMDNDAHEVCVACNSQHPDVVSLLERLRQTGLPLRHIVRQTPSSMHTMYELSPLLDGAEPFVLTTVDTVFREREFSRYVAAWQQMAADGSADGLMGVTDYIDDEKPLYVATDEAGHISAFLDSDPCPHYVSAGIYGLTPRSLPTLRRAVERGESRMRNYQRALIADGLRLAAWPFTEVFDVDHADDIRKAERIRE